MRFTAVLLFLMMQFVLTFGYYNQIGITVGNRELTIRCDFSFSNDSVKIVLPKRARLSGIMSPGIANLVFYNDKNTIIVGDVIKVCRGRLKLTYTLPIPSSEFSVTDWMPLPDEKGVFSATVLSPEGERGMFLPYRNRDQDGYKIDPADDPILFSGRYNIDEGFFGGRKFETAYLARMEIPLSNVARLLNGYEKWLFPLEQKSVYLVEMPMNSGTVRIAGDKIFIVANSTRKEEIGRILASLYFKTLLGWNENYSYAFTDLYKRMIDEDGMLKRDEAERIAVPGDEYYLKVLKRGFERTELDRVGVSDLMRNYALLHFCYYTLGSGPFLTGVRGYLLSAHDQPEGLEKIFTNSGDSRQAVEFSGKWLLPVAGFIPDLILKGPVVFRSTDKIPDVSVRVDGEIREINWDGRRSVDLKVTNGSILVDPFRMVPQLDFYNDREVFDTKRSAEEGLVYRSVLQHRHYSGETFRGLLDLKYFEMPSVNAFGIEAGSPVYVAVSRFTAPVNLRLMEGLKELVLTVGTNAKVKVLAERIRF